MPTLSDESNRLDLDERARRQLRYLDRRAGRRGCADVLRIHLVHPREVVEVLQEHGLLHEPVERASRLLEDRAQVREHLLRLLADRSALQLLVAGLQRELAGHEEEAACFDRLRVRRSLERRGRCLGANDILHESSLESGTWRQASPSAAPTALKIAASTCCGSVPSTSRTCRFRPAARASSSRNRDTTSVASPP